MHTWHNKEEESKATVCYKPHFTPGVTNCFHTTCRGTEEDGKRVSSIYIAWMIGLFISHNSYMHPNIQLFYTLVRFNFFFFPFSLSWISIHSVNIYHNFIFLEPLVYFIQIIIKKKFWLGIAAVLAGHKITSLSQLCRFKQQFFIPELTPASTHTFWGNPSSAAQFTSQILSEFHENSTGTQAAGYALFPAAITLNLELP